MRPVLSSGVIRGFLLAILLAGSSEGSTVLPSSLEDQVDQADAIFLGRAVSSSTATSPSGAIPYTFISFDVVDVLKGPKATDPITLRFLGGEERGVALQVVGTPQFVEGEVYLLFVSGNGTSATPLVGLGQGTARVLASSGPPQLVDLEGRPLLGVRDGSWVRGSAEPTAVVSGGAALFQKRADAGGEPGASSQTQALRSAADVPALGALRDLVRARRSSPTFRAERSPALASRGALPELN